MMLGAGLGFAIYSPLADANPIADLGKGAVIIEGISAVFSLWFGCWIGFGVEQYPFGLLTMIVSLEAIFLSTFVMISQNRADAKRQALADQQWQMVKVEDIQNQELLELSHQILELTQAIHAGHGDAAGR